MEGWSPILSSVLVSPLMPVPLSSVINISRQIHKTSEYVKMSYLEFRWKYKFLRVISQTQHSSRCFTLSSRYFLPFHTHTLTHTHTHTFTHSLTHSLTHSCSLDLVPTFIISSSVSSSTYFCHTSRARWMLLRCRAAYRTHRSTQLCRHFSRSRCWTRQIWLTFA